MQHSLSTSSLALPTPNPPTATSFVDRNSSNGTLLDIQGDLDTSVSMRQQSQLATERDSISDSQNGGTTDEEDCSASGSCEILHKVGAESDTLALNAWEGSDDKRISDIDTAEYDDGTPELFQPSSPLDVSDNFILEDIMEEGEPEDPGESRTLASRSLVAPSSTNSKRPSRTCTHLVNEQTGD